MIFSSQFHIYYLIYKIKYSEYIIKFIYNYYTHLDHLYIRIIIKDIKCLEYNKNNKKYINTS